MASKRYLLIDGQIFQSAARDRGMGRYSEYLLSAILKENSYAKVFIIFSKKSYAAGLDNKSLKDLFPGAETIFLDLSSTLRQRLKGAEEHNRKVINEFVGGLDVDVSIIDFLIPSLFQEPIVPVFPDRTRNFVIFYDLIPYLYHKRYADKMPFDNYLQRFKLLFGADRILTISQAVRDDLAVYLGIPLGKTEVIDGAAIRSSKKPVCPPGFTVPEKFILMPTSDDPRKNNLRAVLGFEEFNAHTDGAFKLVITSKIHRSEKERLQNFSKNIIFTGNIAEAELDWLYEKADAILFVPESEGLGLPILEAVQVNKKVICSTLDVFKEISENAFYFCDHESQHSIATALGHALGNGADINQDEYARILKHYSWKQTAKRAIAAMADTKKRKVDNKPKIAVFTPAPDGFSAVGKVVAETHAVLDEFFDVDYYAEKGIVNANARPNYLKYVANYYPAESFSVKSYAKYHAVFYHIGNSEYHLRSIANSLYLPGYVIMHDTNISDAFRVMISEDIVSKERNELELALVKAGRIKLSKHLVSVVTNQLGVITHSEYATRAAREILREQKTPMTRVNLATQVPQMVQRRSHSNLRLGMAGIIADIKGIEVIERLAKDVKYQEHSIAIFGYNYASEDTTERLRSYDNISLETNLTDFDFVNCMKKLDVFVNYRMQYQGETSLSTLEAMRQGVVVIVRNVGWYSELPDDVVVKVDNPDELVERLNQLVDDPTLLKKISENAIDYVREYYNHYQYAEGMLRIIDAGGADADIAERVKHLKAGHVTSKNILLDLIETSSGI